MAGETWPRFCVSGSDGDETSDVENASRLLGGVLLKGNSFLHEDIVEGGVTFNCHVLTFMWIV